MSTITTDDMLLKLCRAPAPKREAALAAAEAVLNSTPQVILVSQAGAARELSASRFTIRRLVQDGVLHPVRLRGLVRYRRSELLKLAGEVQ